LGRKAQRHRQEGCRCHASPKCCQLGQNLLPLAREHHDRSCSAEFGAASGARHDLERFGVLPLGSLRQSDLLVVEGTITKKMAKRLRIIYDQMAIPRYVIAMGDCAISGGLFHDSYSIVNGAHEFLPVDVYVPGCPPRPEALEQAIIMLQEKIRHSKVYSQG
jgi:NADH-quinone oxidoreductase subunit B